MAEVYRQFKHLTLCVLLDAFRWDYVNKDDTPFLWEFGNSNTYVEKLFNPGGYCERSVFMTGANPETTGNYFAMSLMPIGYKRAYYEPRFNIPSELRNRLCMTEDTTLDFTADSFYNPDTNQTIESIWDVLQRENKTFAFEGCVALGARSYKGVTTHGNRPTQLLKKIARGVDFAYIQFSETDQQLHYRGTSPDNRRDVVRWADSQVKMLYEKARELYDQVDLIVFGDHGMMDVTEHVDLALEYPPFRFGWDYLYLKSSAAIQFWTFNPQVDQRIMNDPKLLQSGKFMDSPSKRQGDFLWLANPGVLVTPCHFHSKADTPKSMHGYSAKLDSMQGFLMQTGPTRKIKRGRLNDVCVSICDSVGIRLPKYCEGERL